MAEQKCIMVVGAHAADAEIMGGATILKQVAAGWRAVMVHMTPGEKGHQTLTPEEYARVKENEARAAAELLQSAYVMLPYGDGELPVDMDVQWAIADEIRRYRPDILITHWKGSIHRDHISTYTNVLESLFFAALPAFKRAEPAHRVSRVYFAENWEDMEGFRPEVYLDIGDVFEGYVRAIRAYSLFRGKVSTFPYEQWYRGASEMRGAEAGCSRAVALMRPEGIRRTVLRGTLE